MTAPIRDDKCPSDTPITDAAVKQIADQSVAYQAGFLEELARDLERQYRRSDRGTAVPERMTFDDWWNKTGADAFGVEHFHACREAWRDCRLYCYPRGQNPAEQALAQMSTLRRAFIAARNASPRLSDPADRN